MSQQRDELEPEDVQLVLDCPFCGRPVPYPGQASDGSETMAECERCDVYFGFHPDEVYILPLVRETDSRPSQGLG